MKKTLFFGSILLLALLLGLPELYAQPQGTSAGSSSWFCPWMGQAMGQGMRQGMGRGNGPGRGRCMMGRGRGAYNPQGQPMTGDQARQVLESYLASGGRSNAKVGDIADKGDVFEATVSNGGDSAAEKIQVDKQSGWLRNVQ